MKASCTTRYTARRTIGAGSAPLSPAVSPGMSPGVSRRSASRGVRGRRGLFDEHDGNAEGAGDQLRHGAAVRAIRKLITGGGAAQLRWCRDSDPMGAVPSGAVGTSRYARARSHGRLRSSSCTPPQPTTRPKTGDMKENS
ncbi:hypothetical protein Acsp04_21690 [Actinomadura sp. NBRC 104425]|nr:hypothetical protein Acsp04_21690 [Actinomadura sp. NBRC 104425]